MIYRFLLIILTFFAVGVDITPGESLFAPGGIGYPTRAVSPQAIGMGGAGIAQVDSIYLHSSNPAGWFNTGLTRFSIGMRLYRGNSKDRQSQDDTEGFNFPGASLAFPLYHTLGLGFQYQTLTDNNFLIRRKRLLAPLPNDENGSGYLATERNQGDGGLSRVGVIIAGKEKNIALGASADIYFGRLENFWELAFQDDALDTSGQVIRRTMFGYGARLGMIADLTPQWSVASIISLPVRLDADLRRRISRGAWYDEKSSMYFELPFSAQLGTSYQTGRWRGNLDLGLEFWSKTSRDWGEIEGAWKYINTPHLAVGIERLPLRGALEPTYQKWIYRTGFHFDQHYLEFGDDPVNEYGFAVGFGRPVRSQAGIVDIAITYDIRGSESKNGAQEKIIGFHFGWSIKEQWFQRLRGREGK